MDNLKKIVNENPDLRQFLQEISSWIVRNDYECGPEGSDIYDKISDLIKNNN